MRKSKTAFEKASRRDFIAARLRRSQRHIASLLVHARPDRLAAVEAELTRLAGVESHGSDGAGKLILTLETGSDGELVQTMNRIETTEDVVAASLVYHHTGELSDDG